jgi:hypothetical protein
MHCDSETCTLRARLGLGWYIKGLVFLACYCPSSRVHACQQHLRTLGEELDAKESVDEYEDETNELERHKERHQR